MADQPYMEEVMLATELAKLSYEYLKVKSPDVANKGISNVTNK